MIVMLDTSQDLSVCEVEVGCAVEQLFTPLTRRDPQRPEQEFAIDNGAFARFDREEFLRCIEKHKPRRDLCRWVALPDVVGSARRTLESFEFWSNQLVRWRKALVIQDGIEDLTIPWQYCDAVFIGGSTKFKLSGAAADVVRTAKICGKWVHAGRVNTPGRLEYFEELGAESIDGTGLSRFSWMRAAIWRTVNEPGLFTGAVA